MEEQEAKETIRQALDLAIQKGCYNLSDIDLIIQALKKIEE
tara:strand:- start:1108 stop:1230 length:123 start_codon:yes stop_codon:yes gene_type:complete